jgi:hypothetical protein
LALVLELAMQAVVAMATEARPMGTTSWSRCSGAQEEVAAQIKEEVRAVGHY